MNFKRFQLNLIHLDAVDSTNNYAANLIKTTNVVNGTTILTKRQESGRGQRGTKWHTSDNLNLIQSTVVFSKIKTTHVFYLNIAVSLAVNKTLSDVGISSKIKWPNDIYVGQKKIAGILIENQLQGGIIGSTIIGIGLNVNEVEFPENLEATSVKIETGKEFDLLDVFHQLYGYLDFYMDVLMQSNYDLLLKRYYKELYQYKIQAEYQDENGTFTGEIQGIDPSGKLQIKTDQEMRSYDLKEVKFLMNNNK